MANLKTPPMEHQATSEILPQLSSINTVLLNGSGAILLHSKLKVQSQLMLIFVSPHPEKVMLEGVLKVDRRGGGETPILNSDTAVQHP